MAIYNLQSDPELTKFQNRVKEAIAEGYRVEFKASKSRTSKQNSALHLYFTIISAELNELGIQYQYTGITGNTFELRYTPELVKNFIWRPIQISMFEIKSTRKIDTKQINEIIDVITNFFGGQGITIEFPSIESLTNQNKEL